MISPINDISAIAPKLKPNKIRADDLNRDKQTPKFDAAIALAEAERKDRKIAGHKDQQMTVAVHEDGPLHIHIEETPVAGPYNLSIYLEGDYCPEHDEPVGTAHSHSSMTHRHGSGDPGASSKCDPGCVREFFTRLLTTLVPVSSSKPSPASKVKRGVTTGRKKTSRPRKK